MKRKKLRKLILGTKAEVLAGEATHYLMTDALRDAASGATITLNYSLEDALEVKKMNLNELAKRLSEREGLKKELSIAQIKELLRCLGDELRMMNVESLFEVLKRLVK